MYSADRFAGPFIATVCDWVCPPRHAVVFGVMVSGAGGFSHTVFRRYSEFDVLKSAMHLMSGCDLPPLPPKSFFRKRLCSSFLEQRRQGLTTFLAAALASDPRCQRTPALRRFLGLGELELPPPILRDAPSNASLASGFSGRALYSVVEGLETQSFEQASCAGNGCPTSNAQESCQNPSRALIRMYACICCPQG